MFNIEVESSTTTFSHRIWTRQNSSFILRQKFTSRGKIVSPSTGPIFKTRWRLLLWNDIFLLGCRGRTQSWNGNGADCCVEKWLNCTIAIQKTLRVWFVSHAYESILGRSEDWLCSRSVFRYDQFISSQYIAVEILGWLNSGTSAFRVNLFRLLSSTVDQLEELTFETFRVKRSE